MIDATLPNKIQIEGPEIGLNHINLAFGEIKHQYNIYTVYSNYIV